MYSEVAQRDLLLRDIRIYLRNTSLAWDGQAAFGGPLCPESCDISALCDEKGE